MPGGRLTHEEREQIAAGLADGLGYSEIARDLGRPTSTVSREVSRNGGPDGYLADEAHRATEGRARRGKPAATQAAPSGDDAGYGRDGAAVRAFEASITDVLVSTGLPRMVSRVLTSIYVTDSGSMTAGELAGRLGVSPASISKSVAYLENRGLVRRERASRRGRERYVIDGDMWYQSMIASARSNELLSEATLRGAHIFGADTPAGARLVDASEFLGQISKAIVQVVEDWRATTSRGA